ncbi:MAG: hypothetical protein JST66_13610 [Bacteroidetes bacterium]|nr:hypothetical protein [Bacteroidota bacterium]
MIIVFKGRGWLVPLTGIASVAVCAIAGLKDPIIVWSTFGLSGLVDHYLGRKWNSAEGRLYQDLHTGDVVEVRPEHSFFWIPMQYWLYIKLAIAAACILFVVTRTTT